MNFSIKKKKKSPKLAFFLYLGDKFANWEKNASFREKFLKMEKFIFSV